MASLGGADTIQHLIGTWRSLVARSVRDAEVVGSNPAVPTISLLSVCIYPCQARVGAHARKGRDTVSLSQEPKSKSGWLVDVLAGGFIGGIVGGIAAINLVIFAGIEPGYEATLPEVFSQSWVVGIVTVVVLMAGPIVGVIVARRIRRRRSQA